MLKSSVLATCVGAAALLAGGTSAQAASTLSVGPTSLCGDDGCFTSGPHGYTYRQTFSARDFKGPSAISALRIDKALLGSMKDNVLKISFQRADGTVVSNWGGWVLAVLGGDTVTISGPGFDWGDDLGDLVLNLELVVPGKGGAGGLGWGAGGTPPAFFGDVFPGQGAGPPQFSHAPPEFMNRPPDSAPTVSDAVFMVPEPSTWALMLLGFGGTGAMLRRARRLAPVALPQP